MSNSNHNTANYNTYSGKGRVVITLQDERPPDSGAMPYSGNKKTGGNEFLIFFIIFNIILLIFFPFCVFGGIILLIAGLILRYYPLAGIIIFIFLLVGCDDFFICLLFAAYELFLFYFFIGAVRSRKEITFTSSRFS